MNLLTDRIKRALLEVDGSCRDVNFTGVNNRGADNMFSYLSKNFSSISVTNQDGEEANKSSLQDWKKPEAGKSLHLNLGLGMSSFSQAQCFINWDEELNPFVEFTFFPQDVEDVSGVLPFLQKLSDELGATRFCVRYENASWTPESPGNENDVLFDSAFASRKVQLKD